MPECVVAVQHRVLPKGPRSIHRPWQPKLNPHRLCHLHMQEHVVAVQHGVLPKVRGHRL